MTDPDDIGARLRATHEVASAAYDAWIAAGRERKAAIQAARKADPEWWTYRQIARHLGLDSHQSVMRMHKTLKGENTYVHQNERARRLRRERSKQERPEGETE